VGTGPLYQGRFKSFPIQQDEHLLTVCRYVERNPVRAKLVRRAQSWRWSSLWQRGQAEGPEWLLEMAKWPVRLPRNWAAVVNGEEDERELEALRRSVGRGAPFGEARWVARTAARLKLESSLRPPWRPKGRKSDEGDGEG